MNPRRARTFHLGDRYAAFSLRGADRLDASFAGTDVYVAARGVSNSVIPGVDEDELILTGANDIEVEQVTEVLLARYSQRDLWSQPTITMELRSYVTQLIYHGEVFVRLHLDRAAVRSPTRCSRWTGWRRRRCSGAEGQAKLCTSSTSACARSRAVIT